MDNSKISKEIHLPAIIERAKFFSALESDLYDISHMARIADDLICDLSGQSSPEDHDRAAFAVGRTNKMAATLVEKWTTLHNATCAVEQKRL